MIKLSIIIPCYNCEKTLREAVDSCYLQGFTEEEFEIVMVNDCSTDSTWSLMTSLGKAHNNIRIFSHEENKGGGSTRNTATKEAEADVIFCLDSDDVLPPGTLHKMYQFLLHKKCDGVCFHYSVSFNKTNINDIDHVADMGPAGEEIPFESLLQRNNHICPLYHVFMFTKQAFVKTGGYPTEHGFDTQGFAWRFLGEGLKAYVCPDSKYLIRINFHESYYVREYNDGRINANWQKIFLENIVFFDEATRHFILNFDSRDFTKDILQELRDQPKVFRDNYEYFIGNRTEVGVLPQPTSPKYIKRNSMHGLYLRIKNKLQK